MSTKAFRYTITRRKFQIRHFDADSIYHILDQQVAYYELGRDYLDTNDPKTRLRYHIKQIARLGFKVTLETSDRAV